ncbi:hypothetical protein [Brevundimonas sp.]|uniref:hypothetical protein n=1 Tax=Brevundimonas sp. TaxID=1871086 RepID=UPI002737FD9C|nr:hypothetical protein [Brevundimonas sp.]MDP3803243.1 hypothetical protein [Brevundimonas sp.]
MRIIIAAAAGALALAACTPRSETGDTAAAAPEVAEDTAAVAVPEEPAAPPASPAAPGNSDGVYPPGQTPPTLPVEPGTTSPATSPPPQ